MKIKPLGDRVIVQRMEHEPRKGGIVIPESAEQKSTHAKVIAVGAGRRDEAGALIPIEVKPGDVVLLGQYGGTDVKIDDQDYTVVRQDDIVGIIEQKS